ncbi:alpha/beta hydrolase [Pseudonocardia xinjiangensis]|uniref:alpha/beta hydrolase n=1 Tax=Pseudonocardia xinjiangensis TaxID=75289 RepID=UPI003D89DA91
MFEEIEFDAEGVTLRGRFHPVEGGAQPAPCVVMAHGWGGTIRHFIDDFAEVFAAAGLAVVLYDHRGWGRSDVAAGKPRHEVDPWEQIRDYQHAITYAQNRPDVDAGRIGVWGTSFSAGHAFVVGAIDRRVGAVVGQAPFISGSRELRALVRVDMVAPTREAFAADRQARYRGEAPAVVPLVAEDPSAQAGLPSRSAYEYFFAPGGAAERDPEWANEITLRSVEYLAGYEPGWYVPQISPTPVLMVVAPADDVAPGDWALEAYERALQPKKLVTVPGDHFAGYRGAGAQIASTAARDWFVDHLLKRSEG